MIFIILLDSLLAVKAVEVTVEVKGRFNCSTSLQDAPVNIELWEDDVFGDDLLVCTTVRPQKSFQLKGTQDELFYINPYLVIMHMCKGHHEKVPVYFGDISENILVDFGDQHLEDCKLQEKMEDIINTQLGRSTSHGFLLHDGVVPSMG